MWSRFAASHPRRLAALKVAYVNGRDAPARVCDSRAQRAERDSWRGTRMALLDRASCRAGSNTTTGNSPRCSASSQVSPGGIAALRELCERTADEP